MPWPASRAGAAAGSRAGRRDGPAGNPVGGAGVRAAGPWLVLVAGTAVLSLLLDLAGLPSPELFAGLSAGIAWALTRPPLVVPTAAGTGAQAVVGVAIGLLVQPESLRQIGSHLVPVVAVTLATLLLSLAAGALMGVGGKVDVLTGALSQVAGGASGLVAISRELGADERVVGVVQYLRVVLVVVTVPPVAGLLPRGSAVASAPASGQAAGWPVTVLVLVGCVTVGVLAGERTRLPAGSLLARWCWPRWSRAARACWSPCRPCCRTWPSR